MAKVVRNKGRSKRVAKAPAEAPVSDEIRAAAARMGLPIPKTIGEATTIAQLDRARRLGKATLTFTVDEVCGAIGHAVDASTFAADALTRLSEQIDAEAFACRDEANRWDELQSIAARATFAALVTRKLEEIEVAS